MRLRSAVALILSFFLPACVAATDSGKQARLLGTYAWEDAAPWFGGFSSIDLLPNGQDFVATTDRGSLVFGRLDRDGDQITSVSAQKRFELVRGKDDPLAGQRGDAEGITLTKDGGVCVSFEYTHRVGCFATPDSDPVVYADIPAFSEPHPNSVLESLAIDPQGRLVVIPENAPSLDHDFPVFRWQNGTWQAVFDIPRIGGFLPVGADFGPDGRLYVLEREFGSIGFRSRVRSWDVSRDRADAEIVHLETFYLVHSNLEGLSVWRDDMGRTRLTMISDDNFLDLLRTEIVEYVLPPLAIGASTH
ncbi:MAG: esterase-like activity of phytase family protein [Paracoccaceae bacterium]